MRTIMRASLDLGHDVDLAPLFLGNELYAAVGLCEKRIIFADAHVFARVERGAVLSDYYRAGGNELAAERLQAETLAGAIAPVAG